MLFVSHDLAVVRYLSDRIVVMKDGYVQQIGTPREIASLLASARLLSLP